MSRLAVLCGVPGSGKSTLAAAFKKLGYYVICPDDIRAELYGDASVQGNPKAVFEIAFLRLRRALLFGSDVVFDATNCRPEYRKNILESTDGYSRAVCLWLDIPLEKCLEQNGRRERRVPEYVIRRMWRELHADIPDKSEGFTKVVRLGEDELEALIEGALKLK